MAWETISSTGCRGAQTQPDRRSDRLRFFVALFVVERGRVAYAGNMKRDLLKRTLRLLDLPEDMDPRVPRITVLGREKMLVENVVGIRRCTEEEVLLLTGCGPLQVSGEKLIVKELGESRALIVGRLIRWAYGE